MKYHRFRIDFTLKDSEVIDLIADSFAFGESIETLTSRQVFQKQKSETMNTQKVTAFLLIWESPYEDENTEIIGLFKTRQGAEEYKISKRLKKGPDGQKYDIIEMEIK